MLKIDFSFRELPVLVENETLLEVLPQILDQLRGRSGAVGQLELLQVAQLDEVGKTAGCQEGTAWNQECVGHDLVDEKRFPRTHSTHYLEQNSEELRVS